jgi:hypothetical protein
MSHRGRHRDVPAMAALPLHARPHPAAAICNSLLPNRTSKNFFMRLDVVLDSD